MIVRGFFTKAASDRKVAKPTKSGDPEERSHRVPLYQMPNRDTHHRQHAGWRVPGRGALCA